MDFKIEKTKIDGYKWTCPKDGKEITGTSEKRVRSLAKQHWYTKHG